MAASQRTLKLNNLPYFCIQHVYKKAKFRGKISTEKRLKSASKLNSLTPDLKSKDLLNTKKMKAHIAYFFLFLALNFLQIIFLNNSFAKFVLLLYTISCFKLFEIHVSFYQLLSSEPFESLKYPTNTNSPQNYGMLIFSFFVKIHNHFCVGLHYKKTAY